jgi:hypothetical protein
MGKLTQKGQQYLLGAGFKGATEYTTLYIGIGTATGLTDASTTISEPTSDTAYARKPITSAQWSTAAENTSSQSEISNTVDIVTNAWNANQVTALATVGIFSALTGGDLLAYSDILDGGGLPTTLSPVAGQAVRLPAGQIKVSLD